MKLSSLLGIESFESARGIDRLDGLDKLRNVHDRGDAIQYFWRSTRAIAWSYLISKGSDEESRGKIREMKGAVTAYNLALRTW